ncbi:MAG: hypothetical protein SOX43_01825 [Pelistega sp.]|nr:hypothetical protein [Pelistega sp.]
MMIFTPLTVEEQAQIKATLGSLPIRGEAWPKWVKGAAILMLVVIVIQTGLAISKVGLDSFKNIGGLTILVVFIALLVMTYYMVKAETTISDKGLHQTWISKREVSWEDVTFAKFVPLLASKRLVIFVKKGRPVVFQGGTKELQIAFAHISLQFKNRNV